MVLPLVARNPVGAVGAVTIFGIGFGLTTIARSALLVDRYGTAAYGSLNGAMALPVTLAKACAPLLAAALAPIVGYSMIMIGVALVCGTAAAALSIYHCLPAARAKVDRP